jgi:hypothetical protein
MKVLKKILPILVVLVLVAVAYFMFAKNRLQTLLAKTTLSDAQQKNVLELCKLGTITIFDESDNVQIVLTLPDESSYAANEKNLKFAGFIQDAGNKLVFVGVFAKKK